VSVKDQNERRFITELAQHAGQWVAVEGNEVLAAADSFDGLTELIGEDSEAMARMDRVAELIEGFEDPFGLELLSSLHWVVRQNPEARENPEVAISAVQAWSPRKKQQLKREHLLRAWDRLKEQRWIPAPHAISQLPASAAV